MSRDSLGSMRTHARSLALLSATTFLLLAGCDKKADDKKVDDKKADSKKADDEKVDDKKAEVAQPEAPQPETAAVLALGAVKIMEKDKPDEAIELTADGTLKVGPNPDHTLKVSTDGKISKADGTVVAQVGADGVLTMDGKPSGVVLSDTGMTMTGPDGKTGTAKFLEDGTIAVDPAPAENLQMVAEGCTGPMVKTCALILTMLLLMEGEPVQAGTGVEVGPDPRLVEPK
jgi:hypothetical protein